MYKLFVCVYFDIFLVTWNKKICLYGSIDIAGQWRRLRVLNSLEKHHLLIEQRPNVLFIECIQASKCTKAQQSMGWECHFVFSSRSPYKAEPLNIWVPHCYQFTSQNRVRFATWCKHDRALHPKWQTQPGLSNSRTRTVRPWGARSPLARPLQISRKSTESLISFQTQHECTLRIGNPDRISW